MSFSVNRQITLADRPHDDPGPEHFKLVEKNIPVPGPDEMLLKTQWLSLDPYMRGRMDERASYAKPVEIGEVMVGGTVGAILLIGAGEDPIRWSSRLVAILAYNCMFTTALGYFLWSRVLSMIPATTAGQVLTLTPSGCRY